MDKEELDKLYRSLTPAMRKQIAEALLLYQSKHNIKWAGFKDEILASDGVPSKERHKDKRLSKSDPRHWIVYNHEPTEDKMKLYLQFVFDKFKPFHFNVNRNDDYISIGHTIARFAEGSAKWKNHDFKLNVRTLTNRVFTSERHSPILNDDDNFAYTFRSFRQIEKTPLLLGFSFDVRYPKRELSDAGLEETSPFDEASLRFLWAWGFLNPKTMPIYATQRGVYVPLPSAKGYHGIAQSDNYKPFHMQLTVGENSKFQTFTSQPDTPSLPLTFRHIPELDIMSEIFDNMGDPIL